MYILSLAIIALAVACSQKPPAQQTTIGSKPFTPPAQPYTFDAEDGQWTMPAKNYATTRFSGLSEINTGNVKNLKVAWTVLHRRRARSRGSAARLANNFPRSMRVLTR